MNATNRVQLTGNLGNKPEIKTFESGSKLATFSLATNEVWNDKSGQRQERTEWHRVEIFGKAAQVAKEYLSKGRAVYIEGSLRYDEWTDKDGNKRNTTRVRVSGPNSRLVLLGGRGEGQGGARRGAASEGGPEPSSPASEVPPAADDDVPF